MIKKERVVGMVITYDRTLLQSIRAFFNVTDPEKASIPFFSGQYRTYKKKIVREGRLTKWENITTGAEKEKKGIARLQKAHLRSGW